jgi:hypothetical protein
MTFIDASLSDNNIWNVPDGWQQGRGAWGGLVVAAAVRHAASSVVDRTIRSVACHLMAPVPVGPMYLASEVLRAGSAMTTVRTTMVDESGTTCVDVVTIWSTDRASDIAPPFDEWGTASMPSAPTWADIPIAPVEPPLGPTFAQHLEFRVIEGFPMTGTTSVLGWISLRQPLAQWDAAHLLGMVDAWWPGAISMSEVIRPMATVAFSAQLLCDPQSISPAVPLLHEAWVSKAIGGFTAETRRLWTPDGQLVVENYQSIAIIR